VSARQIGVGVGLLIAAAALVVIVLAAIGQSATRTETGLVVAVDSSGLTDVRGFTIRTADGRSVTFRIGVLENGAQFPPGHLLEHSATGVRVVVTYREENGGLVAIRLDDAPGAQPAPTGSGAPAASPPASATRGLPAPGRSRRA
jgi:hypothetical protein